MPIITLPDGSTKSFDAPVTVAEVAGSIGAGLAKAALAGRVNEALVDTSFVIESDANLAIITERDEDGLEIIRHSTAHLLAQAVQQLFPDAQVTIGPVIEDGFYYDFAFERGFTPDDLTAIEQRMHDIAKQDLPVTRSEMPRDEAIAFFRDKGEEYKAKIIEDIPAGETLSLYQQGEFIDLCRGPHVPSTGKLKAFKLTKLAGAYWRGDASNEMLQRIYGTAWSDKKALKAYLHRLEEAEKRDHRKIAKKLDLFHTQEEAPGMIFWHPKGWSIYQTVRDHMRAKFRKYDYQEINTPLLVDSSLWQRSGHSAKYSDDMFFLQIDEREYAIKPMNCPCHVQVFNQGLKSYRDLPIRFAEFGSCHRNEASGALHGLMRVRGFTQDDAHIFCTPDQIHTEVSKFLEMLFETYTDFGFNDIIVELSGRPEKRVGSDEIWDKAESMLEQALNESGLDWKPMPGEGAFYGPKLDFSLKDCIGRVWQCGTLQLDFFMPERLGAEYVAEDNSRHTPVMLHRAICGSLERFIGILVENSAGELPLWLAPVQLVVTNITDRQREYAEKVAEALKNRGFRVVTDLRNEKIGFKIREHEMTRVPYVLVLGDREESDQEVAVRKRGGDDLGTMSLETLISQLEVECASLSKSGNH